MLPTFESYFQILLKDPYSLKEKIKDIYEWYDYLNLFDKYAKNKTTFVDITHKNVEGNKIIAKEIL